MHRIFRRPSQCLSLYFGLFFCELFDVFVRIHISSHFSQRPEKQKNAAQNRTKTTNCPNSVSYGAWKFFSPYGSCSACTIRNRFALFGFQSASAVSAFDTQIIQYTLPKKQELYFPLRMRVRLFRLIVKYKKQMSPQGVIRLV